MSDHEIIPPIITGVSDTPQQRDRNGQKDRKKKPQETTRPRTEPMALEDQNITTSPDSDHLIDYEA